MKFWILSVFIVTLLILGVAIFFVQNRETYESKLQEPTKKEVNFIPEIVYPNADLVSSSEKQNAITDMYTTQDAFDVVNNFYKTLCQNLSDGCRIIFETDSSFAGQIEGKAKIEFAIAKEDDKTVILLTSHERF